MTLDTKLPTFASAILDALNDKRPPRQRREEGMSEIAEGCRDLCHSIRLRSSAFAKDAEVDSGLDALYEELHKFLLTEFSYDGRPADAR